MRGGKREGAGRKPKPEAERIKQRDFYLTDRDYERMHMVFCSDEEWERLQVVIESALQIMRQEGR